MVRGKRMGCSGDSHTYEFFLKGRQAAFYSFKANAILSWFMLNCIIIIERM